MIWPSLEFHARAFNAGSTKRIRLLDRHVRIIDHPRNGREGTPLLNNIRSQNFYDMAQAPHKGEQWVTLSRLDARSVAHDPAETNAGL
jgi:hypothetical protein